MTERQRQICYNIIYRQLSRRYWSEDLCRTYVLYVGYVFLIGIWALSIFARVTQWNMRIFMLLQATIIFFGETVRFLQETFWTHNIYLTRISGRCFRYPFAVAVVRSLCWVRHRTGGQLSHSAEMVLTHFFCLSRSGCSFSVYLLILQGRFGFLYWKYEKVLNLKLKNGDKWFMKKMLKK